jgi:D-alanyl-D-alanine-carboxypeptidase/D-alanyl-D-alanine-endopeptidase
MRWAASVSASRSWYGAAIACASACAGRPAPRYMVPSQPALGVVSPTQASPAHKARLVAIEPALDQFFRAQVQASGATGAAIGIIVDGELAYQRGFGVQEIESGRAVDADTVFRIASLTKSFTALSVVKLRDEGRLSLDAPIASYLSELASLVGPTRDSPPNSARSLLTHASGLAYDDIWGAVTYGKTEPQFSELLRAGISFSSAPGTSFAIRI